LAGDLDVTAAPGQAPPEDAEPAPPARRPSLGELAGEARRRLGRGARSIVADGRFTVVLLLVALIGNALVLPVPGVVILAAVALIGAVLSGFNPVTLIGVYIAACFVIPSRFGVAGLSLTMALGAAALVLWLLLRAINGPAPARRNEKVTFWLWVFVGVKLLGYANAHVHFLRPGHKIAVDRQLILVLTMVGIGFYVGDVARNPRHRRIIIDLVVAGAAFMAFTAVLEKWSGVDVASWFDLPFVTDGARVDGEGALFAPDRLGVERVFGTATGPIEFAAMLSAVLPLAAHLAIHGRARFERWIGGAAGLLIVLGLPMSVSRTAVVGFFVAGLLTIIGLERRYRERALLGFGIAVAVLLFAFPAVTDATFGLITDFAGQSGDGIGIEGRTDDYDHVATLIRERPILGRGLGYHLPTEAQLIDGERVRAFYLDNQFLTELVNGGVVAFLATIALPLTGIRAGRRVRGLARDPGDAHLGYSVACALGVLALTWAFFDAFSFRASAGLFFLLLGIAAAMEASVEGRDDSEAPAEPQPGDAQAAGALT
jgi:hypothetical protein